MTTERFRQLVAPGRRVATLAGALALTLVAGLVFVTPASAAARCPGNPRGHPNHLARSGHMATLTGWAADFQHGWSTVKLRVTVDGRVGAIGETGTGRLRPDI